MPLEDASSVIFTGLAMWRVINTHSMPLAAIYAVGAVLLGMIGFAKPRWLALVFSTWLLLTAPVAWVVSAVLLAIVFYGVVTPLGLFFRLIGREELDRRFRTGQDTYWREKPATNDTSRYLKQF